MRPSVLLLAFAACSGEGSDSPVVDAPSATIDSASSDAPPVAANTVIYVVRHAETTTDPNDPPLSTAGMARAQTLANKLAQSGIRGVYSSQLRRTRDTGVPTATAAGLTVMTRTIDSGNLSTYGATLANEVRTAHGGQAALIVGHSNTVPDTVKALSGMTVPAISESEYDRFYTVTITPAGAATLMSATY